MLCYLRPSGCRFPPTGNPKLERQLQELVQPDCTVRELVLAERGLTADATVAVAVMIAHNNSIRRLDYRRNRPELRGLQVRALILCAMARECGLLGYERGGVVSPGVGNRFH